MRIERNSLIAVVLLFMAGCSANRQARLADNVYDPTGSVQMPLRHADEYDSGEYDDEPAPASDETSSPSRAPVPMGEPVPAPPAIGVSRVKSVSWLRGARNRSESENCGDDADRDSCSPGPQTQLPPDYFSEGCVTTPHTAIAPRKPHRERTTITEIVQGWNLRAKTRRAERVRSSRNCGESEVCDASCFAPEGCDSSVNGSQSQQPSPQVAKQSVGGMPFAPGAAASGNHGGSLADPLQENGWDDNDGSPDQRIHPDEMLELPSTLEASPDGEQHRQYVPEVPNVDHMPVLPMPEAASPLLPTPGIQPPAAPAAVPQTNPETVRRIVQPPMWPRLGAAAATSGNVPVATPAISSDQSLPAIQPGRRI
jgi:hypothetical protein